MEIIDVTLKELISRSNITSKKLALYSANAVQLKSNSTSDSSRIKQEMGSAKSSTPASASFNNNSKCINNRTLKAGSQSETDEDDWIKANIIKIDTNKPLKIQRQGIKKDSLSKEKQFESRKRPNDSNLPMQANKKILIDPMKVSNINMIKKKFTPSQSSQDSFNKNENYEVLEHPKTELKFKTQNCFLSLIRDIFCSTSDHRMKLEELRRRINLWSKGQTAPLNVWFKEVDNWENLLVSAVHFLSGEFQLQPEDFVPYLEFKSNLNIYCWIGAGRDNDVRMMNLYKYWLIRRNEMGVKAVNNIKHKALTRNLDDHNRVIVEWKVRAATESEAFEYHIQEKRRYEDAQSPFRFRQHGYESVVGPVHLPNITTKAFDNNTLIAERPNTVNYLSLIVDAVARLPNGEGNLADICKLVKYSQYLESNLSDQSLHSFVTTGLDKLCSEALNPIVQFDNKRKLWIYLHRNYSEEDFKKLHNYQINAKQKKIVYKKVPSLDDSMRLIGNATTVALSKSTKQNVSAINTNILPEFESSKKIFQLRSSPPPLKIASRRYFKSSSSSVEPFDIEASLDAHTMPIAAKDNKTQKIRTVNSQETLLSKNISCNVQKPTLNVNINNQASPIVGQKRIMGKSISVGKNPTPTLKCNAAIGEQNYSISLNVKPKNVCIDANSRQNEVPALCGSSYQTSKAPLASVMQHKNVVKINSNMGKNIMSSQQTPKFILTASSFQKGGKLISIPRNQTPMLSQQKQILTNVIVQQQKAKSEQILLTSNSQQKIPALTISSTSISDNSIRVPSTKFIQIQQPSSSGISTQSQHTVFHLKQLKEGGVGQQAMILKPHILKTTSTSSSELSTPPLVSVSKFLKSSSGSILQSPQIITTTAQKLSTETTNSPIFARVVAAGSQGIGILPGKTATTFKVAGTNTALQRGVLQLAGNQQYSIVSKGKNINPVSSTSTSSSSLSGAHSKIISNQTNSHNDNLCIGDATSTSNIILTSAGSERHTPATHVQQKSLKIVQSGPIATQHLLNAKLFNVQALTNKGIKTSTGTIK